MRFFHAARARLRLLFDGADAEERMNEEIAFHVEMEADRLQRVEGIDPAEARRRAVLAFGAAEAHKEELRGGRGLAWLGSMKLDFKLGFRMLVKYPGLTVVGGVAMAFAIWAGAVTFVLVGQVVNPELPVPDADRVVRIVHWDPQAYEEEARSLSDFVVWRDALRSVRDLGAYRDMPFNLIIGEDARPVRGAEISATAFEVAPVAPLHGRVLEPSDEEPGAAPVVVLGHDVWRDRFDSDPNVIGRRVRLDDANPTVVGVMPEGFGFPVAHELWTPLKPALHAATPRQGPPVEIFGRLAPGATLESAQVELAALGRRAAAEYPETHEHLEPHVVAYTGYYPNDQPILLLLGGVNAFVVLLLVVICSNVALLLFARAASRESELVVRSALGATRRRIMAQLFAEALVLGALAALVGLGAAQLALRTWGVEFLEQNMGALPFWLDISLSPLAVLYACLLTLVGAAIAGVLPARKITRGLGGGLRQDSAGGGGVRFGGVWTAVIVTQVALTVAFPAISYVPLREHDRIRSYDVGFAAEEYLAARLAFDAGGDPAASAARFQSSVEALRHRVAAEPGVSGVTFVDRMPRDYHRAYWIELDGESEPPAEPEVSSATIDPSYFDVLRVPILAGRGFGAADTTADARVVIVDQGFVDRMLQGRNAVGRRIRFSDHGEWSTDQSRPWYEIVGVVRDLGMGFVLDKDRPAGVYLPGVPGVDGAVHMIVRAEGDPVALAPRVQQLAAAVDPTLRMSDVMRADQVTDGILWVIGMWSKLALMLTAIVLLLSLAGIYAVMSFSVVRRTREIGVRVALGGSTRRVLAAIFRRPLTQVATGIAIGFVLVTTAAFRLAGHRPDGAPRVESEMLGFADLGIFVLYAVIMLAVCLLACIVPAMRALRVHPVEALRAE